MAVDVLIKKKTVLIFSPLPIITHILVVGVCEPWSSGGVGWWDGGSRGHGSYRLYPHHPALTALDQGVAPVHAPVGAHGTSFPALVGVGHQIHGDFWQTVGLQKIKDDHSHEDLTDEHEAGKPK